VKEARTPELVRLLDQAFGRPQEAEEDRPEDPGLAALTREQRAIVRQWLLDGTPSGEVSPRTDDGH
jgi:hypothetical protein